MASWPLEGAGIEARRIRVEAKMLSLRRTKMASLEVPTHPCVATMPGIVFALNIGLNERSWEIPSFEPKSMYNAARGICRVRYFIPRRYGTRLRVKFTDEDDTAIRVRIWHVVA